MTLYFIIFSDPAVKQQVLEAVFKPNTVSVTEDNIDNCDVNVDGNVGGNCDRNVDGNCDEKSNSEISSIPKVNTNY